MAHMADTTATPEILRQAPAGRVVLWTGEVATLAGVTPMTITRWVKAGKVAASTTSGGNRRFWPHDVEALLIDLGRPVPPWLAGVTAALGGIRPLELADALAVSLEDLCQLSADLGMLSDWLTQDMPGVDPEWPVGVVRRARRVIDALADREAEGAGQ